MKEKYLCLLAVFGIGVIIVIQSATPDTLHLGVGWMSATLLLLAIEGLIQKAKG